MEESQKTFWEPICGSCQQIKSRDRAASTHLLLCELCPAAYHYSCAGYYDSEDGPTIDEKWHCWRCAREGEGGLAKNWVQPKGPARLKPNDSVHLTYHQDDDCLYEVFYKGTVLRVTNTHARIRWDSFPLDDTNPEVLELTSRRLWHGTLSPTAWTYADAHAYAPNSRLFAPDTFAELSAAAAGTMAAPVLGPTERLLSPPPPIDYDDPEAMAAMMDLQNKGAEFLRAARAYGKSAGVPALSRLSEFLDIRRDLSIHAYSLWVIVMSWGGSTKVTNDMLWSKVASVYHAPPSMTNRSTMLKSMWESSGFSILEDAPEEVTGVPHPPLRHDLIGVKPMAHDIVRLWPGAVRWRVQGDAAIIDTAAPSRKRGRSRAAPGGPRGARSRPRGRAQGSRGKKTARRDSAPGSPAPAEESDSAASEGDGGRPAKRARRPQRKGWGRRPDTDSEDDARPRVASSDDENGDLDFFGAVGPLADGAAAPAGGGTGEKFVTVRKVRLSEMPPKWQEGVEGLARGGISCQFTQRLKLGLVMLRVDELCIHTILEPLPPARALMAEALARPCPRPRVQFMSTEPGFLGGWWDAILEGGRTGSLLEGGMRFLVSERYPDDEDFPEPLTWLPLVHYGPAAYPYQSPQVMIRPTRVGGEPQQAWREGELVEVREGDEAEQPETVHWIGAITAVDADADQVSVRTCVAPYGNADARRAPDSLDGVIVTKQRQLRRAAADDLQGMVREPQRSSSKSGGRARPAVALATTDDVEEVLKPGELQLPGALCREIGLMMHASIKTLPAAADAEELVGRAREAADAAGICAVMREAHAARLAADAGASGRGRRGAGRAAAEGCAAVKPEPELFDAAAAVPQAFGAAVPSQNSGDVNGEARSALDSGGGGPSSSEGGREQEDDLVGGDSACGGDGDEAVGEREAEWVGSADYRSPLEATARLDRWS